MVVLALETSTRAGSVALLDGEICRTHVGDRTRTHAERLPGELLDLLASQGRAVADVDVLAVITGPGSFTGLRVGLAAVQGLAMARALRVVPVPTLDAMAQARLWARADPSPITVVACLDGHRGELFAAAWRARPGQALTDADLVLTPRVSTPASLVAAVQALPAPVVAVLAGDQTPALLGGLDDRVARVDLPMTLAEVAARVAARDPDRGVAPHALQPIYLRRPDAELARERAAAIPPRP